MGTAANMLAKSKQTHPNLSPLTQGKARSAVALGEGGAGPVVDAGQGSVGSRCGTPLPFPIRAAARCSLPNNTTAGFPESPSKPHTTSLEHMLGQAPFVLPGQ